MPETIRNRILAVALMAALVLVSISPATVLVQAQEVYVHDSRVVESTTTSDCAVTKHETVYVNLAADGAVQQVNVSDHLHTELPQVRIEDASDLSDITDVKTGETPERSNGRLFWQMDGTDLYYSGRSDSTPPMQFDIDYMINGVPIAPDQLAGKSGRLTIHVEAENTLVKPVTVNGVSYDLTCPMLLVGGMLLPEEGFENVEVSNGAVLGDGAHRIVLMMGVPGMEESLGISALGLPLLGEQMGAGSFTIGSLLVFYSFLARFILVVVSLNIGSDLLIKSTELILYLGIIAVENRSRTLAVHCIGGFVHNLGM